MPLSISAEEGVSLAYAKEHNCGTLVAMLIATMQAYGYRGDDITTRGLNRSVGLTGDFRVLIEQLNRFLREGTALRIVSSYVRRRIQDTIWTQQEYTHQSQTNFPTVMLGHSDSHCHIIGAENQRSNGQSQRGYVSGISTQIVLPDEQERGL